MGSSGATADKDSNIERLNQHKRKVKFLAITTRIEMILTWLCLVYKYYDVELAITKQK